MTEYTTFRAELAVLDGDLVYHFYPTPEVNAKDDPQKYWNEVFPNALQQAATTYFNADYPRLKAAYAEEMASWWLRAYGFANTLEPMKLAKEFCAVLDSVLEVNLQVTALEPKTRS